MQRVIRVRSIWLGCVSSLAIASIPSWIFPAQAQLNLTPDTALDRALGTRVESFSPQIDVIRGGTRPQNGVNLFHSFREFNVRQGRSVYFANPAGVQNILSRVTGGNPSQILGRLGTFGGTANLFLINPSGIVLGPGARLDVQGSFVATTANRIQFGDRGFFSATQPEIPTSLLTVNPSAFWFTQQTPSALRSQSNLLALPNNRDLVLLGGALDLAESALGSIDGRVELGAVSGSGQVGLTVAGNTLQLQFPADLPRAYIALTDNSAVLANQVGTTSIAVKARDFTMTGGSNLFSGILLPGSADRRGGDIDIDATETVLLTGSGTGTGNLILDAISGTAGDTRIRANQLVMRDGAVLQSAGGTIGRSGNIQIQTTDAVRISGLTTIATSTSGRGDAGNIQIQSGGAVTLRGDPQQLGGFIQASVSEGAIGQGGMITIQARSLALRDNYELNASLLGQGNAGNIRIRVQESVSLASGGRIVSNTLGQGNAGDIEITAGGQVQVEGFAVLRDPTIGRRVRDSRVGSEVSRDAMGNAGDITIQSQSLAVRTEGRISTATDGVGNAGTIQIQVVDAVSLSEGGFIGGSVGKTGRGRGGSILLQSRSLNVQEGSQVISSVFGQGEGGDIWILVRDRSAISGSGRLVVGLNPNGSLQSETGFSAIVSTVEPGGIGNAGNIDLETGVLSLDRAGAISTNAASGQGGNLQIQARDYVLLRRGSIIAASAGTEGTPGNGGNITLQTPFLISAPQENSDIAANSFSGRGGRVTVNAEGIFWFVPRSREDLVRLLGTTNPNRLLVSQLPTNDISAISRQDPNLSGVVTLNALDFDPSRGLVALPANLVDPATQIAQRCPARGEPVAGSFYITGTGGIPYRPGDLPISSYDTGLARSLPTATRNSNPAVETARSPAPEPIVEAQGWRKDAKGEVWLVADAAGGVPVRPELNPPTCPQSVDLP